MYCTRILIVLVGVLVYPYINSRLNITEYNVFISLWYIGTGSLAYWYLLIKDEGLLFKFLIWLSGISMALLYIQLFNGSILWFSLTAIVTYLCSALIGKYTQDKENVLGALSVGILTPLIVMCWLVKSMGSLLPEES